MTAPPSTAPAPPGPVRPAVAGPAPDVTTRRGRRASFGALLAAEALKLRRSAVWVVAVVLPVLTVVSGTVNLLMNDLPRQWEGLVSQVLVFYSLFFFSLGVALLGSAAWRPEHRGSSWNAMRTTTHSPQALAAAKTLVITAPVVLMQVMVLVLTWPVGAALGLGPVPPAGFVIECLIAVPAAQPLIALQSLLSMRMRSFAAPVAVCLAGLVVSIALIMKGSALADVWPQSLATRALTLGSTAVSTAGALDASDLAALLAGTMVCGAVCWGALILVARRRGGAL